MATKDEREFWRDLDRVLEADTGIDFSDEGNFFRQGFDLARLIQGVLVAHGYDPKKTPPEKFEQKIGDIYDGSRGVEELFEAFHDGWWRVRIPGGVAAYQGAAAEATGETALEGSFPTQQRRRLAARVYEASRTLIQQSTDGVFGISCRRMAEALGATAIDVSRCLADLVREGYLEKVGVSIPHRRAQCFKLGKRAIKK